MNQRGLTVLYTTVTLGGIISVALWWVLAEITRGLSPEMVALMIESGPAWTHGFVRELGNGFWYEVDNSDMPTVAFLVIQAVLWLVMIVVFLVLNRQRLSPQVTWLIVVFALVFRVFMIGSVPIHENDFYRYLWDGKTLKHGINPYLYEPAALYLAENGIEEPTVDPTTQVVLNGRPWTEEDRQRLAELDHLRGDNHQLYERIGHWQIPTIYPPLAQGFFALSSYCFEDSLLGLKLMLLIFDLGTIGLIVALLVLLKRSTASVILYAWSPLVMVEFSNSAHYDTIPIFFLLLAICLSLGKNGILGSIAAGFGALTKFFGALVVPMLHHPRQWQSWTLYLICALVVIGSYWPFVVWQDAGISRVFQGLQTYSRDWQNNSFVFLIIDAIAGGETYERGKIITGGLFLLCIIILACVPALSRQDMLYKCFLVMGLLFVLNPTGFPWYCAWVIPFLCFFPNPGLIFLTLTISAYYLGFHSEYQWTETKLLGIPTLNWISWGPAFLVLFASGLTWMVEGRKHAVID